MPRAETQQQVTLNTLVEVTHRNTTIPEPTRSLHSFLATYHPKEAWIVTPASHGRGRIGSTTIRLLPNP
jgi:hypothetical protein